MGEAHQMVDTASMDAAVQAAIQRAQLDSTISAAIDARLRETVTREVQLAVDAAVATLNTRFAAHLDRLVADTQATHDNNVAALDDHCAAAIDSFTAVAFECCNK